MKRTTATTFPFAVFGTTPYRRKQVIEDRRVVPARALLLARSAASLRTMRDSSLANKNPSLLACLYEWIAHYQSRAWQSQLCGRWLVGVDHVARSTFFSSVPQDSFLWTPPTRL
jgi:hypothetical protein